MEYLTYFHARYSTILALVSTLSLIQAAIDHVWGKKDNYVIKDSKTLPESHFM